MKLIEMPHGILDLMHRISERVTPTQTQRAHQILSRFFADILQPLEDSTVFVMTGDIPAMWLRDSTWQAMPLVGASKEITTYNLLAAISRRQSAYVCIDPYANAFNPAPTQKDESKEFDGQSPWVFERKYELDSLAAFLDLALRLARVSGRNEHLQGQFVEAVEKVIEVISTEQHHDFDSYKLSREGNPLHDYLSHNGRGAPVGYTGMSWSGFRPSDDACVFGYHIPSNAYASLVLRQLSELNESVFPYAVLKERARILSAQIKSGIEAFGVVEIDGESIWAYEVDGLGNRVLMDDANVPSLLSLPLLGWCDADDALYQATRKFILSLENPYFYQGLVAEGIGSIHTPSNRVWPIALAIEAITSGSTSHMQSTLQLLENTDAGTGNMHESFDVNDPTKFSREWFSWADMTYLLLLLKSVKLA